VERAGNEAEKMMQPNSDIWSVLVDEIRQYERELPSLKVAPAIDVDEIRHQLKSLFDFAKPHGLPELTANVVRMLKDWNVQFVHPRHFGLFCPSVVPAGVIGDALAAVFNPNLGSWWYCPGANEIERHTLEFFLRQVGYDEQQSAAHFTSGGAEANISAVLVALTRAFPAYREEGVASIPAPPTMYVSEEAHDSFSKIAHHTGLGRAALRRIKTDSKLRLDPIDLEHQITQDRNAGRRPFLVVATAGTTGAGVIDPISRIGEVCRRENLWLHVDAAWGGGALVSPRLRKHLQGISDSDSVTWDAHKWLSVPMGAGMFLCKHREAVERAFAVEASAYLSDRVSGTVDLYKASFLWSRRFIGLKVFMTLAALGANGMAAMVEHQAEMGNELRNRLCNRGWEVVNDSPLPLVCFTHPAIRAGKTTTGEVVARMLASESVWLSKVALRGESVLRACITSYQTQSSDVEALVAEADKAVSFAREAA
jgi:glutamate/tyrosine decarboxylase-like PLP-dependent enzyme